MMRMYTACALHVHCMCTACALGLRVHLHCMCTAHPACALALHVHCTHCMYTRSPFGNKNKKAKPTEVAAAAEEEEEEGNDSLTSPDRGPMSPSTFIASASNF